MVGCWIWWPLTNVKASAWSGVTVHTPSSNDIKQCLGWIDGPNSCNWFVFAEPTYVVRRRKRIMIKWKKKRKDNDGLPIKRRSLPFSCLQNNVCSCHWIWRNTYFDWFGCELDTAPTISAVRNFNQHWPFSIDRYVVTAIRDTERFFLSSPWLWISWPASHMEHDGPFCLDEIQKQSNTIIINVILPNFRSTNFIVTQWMYCSMNGVAIQLACVPCQCDWRQSTSFKDWPRPFPKNATSISSHWIFFWRSFFLLFDFSIFSCHYCIVHTVEYVDCRNTEAQATNSIFFTMEQPKNMALFRVTDIFMFH